MHTWTGRRKSPEEEELEKKRGELAELELQLGERELVLVTSRKELSVFENRYLRHVGVLYAELDEWNAKTAELIAARTRTEAAYAKAKQARGEAKESYAAAQSAELGKTEFSVSQELKGLYREVAKKVHPDLAVDETDRELREGFMKRVNQAYETNDFDALRNILQEYEESPAAIRGAGVAADLVRVLRQIRQIRERLTRIEEEIVQLSRSEISQLKEKVESAAIVGRDLLAEMVADLTGRISVARQTFDAELARKSY